MTFDSVVTVGDSWTWGSDLTNSDREHHIFPILVAKHFDLPLTNLGICSATNFNYKWRMLEWFNQNPGRRPLVIVGVTSPFRLLIYDNTQQGFQCPMNYILQDQMAFPSVYGGQNKQGGYRGLQLANPYTGQSYSDLDEVGKNYVLYQLDDEYRDVEIASIWEILFLDTLIRQRGGQAVFWTNLHDFDLHTNQFFGSWFQPISCVNNLKRLPNLRIMNHPTIEQHGVIAGAIIDQIALT
jgi:hypothetical protein